MGSEALLERASGLRPDIEQCLRDPRRAQECGGKVRLMRAYLDEAFAALEPGRPRRDAADAARLRTAFELQSAVNAYISEAFPCTGAEKAGDTLCPPK